MPALTSNPPHHQHQQQNPTQHLPPSAMPLLSPSALLHAHLTHDPSSPNRPSNRALTACRPINLTTSSLSHTHGSSLIRIVSTSIVCGVRGEILPISDIANYRTNAAEDSYHEIKDYALLVPNIELATGCSPLHLPGGPPSTEAQTLSHRLLSLLHTSQIINPADLRIYQEETETDTASVLVLKAFWVLYIDILCLSHGGTGSVFDGAWLALYAALNDTLLPRAWWDADLEGVLCSPERKQGRKLNLRSVPVPVSFGVFSPRPDMDTGKQERWILFDLDTLEEECCEEVGCVVVDCSTSNSSIVEAGEGKTQIIKFSKTGGVALGVQDFEEVVSVAEGRWREWYSVLKTHTRADDRG